MRGESGTFKVLLVYPLSPAHVGSWGPPPANGKRIPPQICPIAFGGVGVPPAGAVEAVAGGVFPGNR